MNEAFQERTTAPVNNKYYTTRFNPYFSAGYGMPNCTCYVWGRIAEILGKSHDLCINDAKDYFYNKDSFKRGKTPKVGAVGCWVGGWENLGHVAVVERITDNYIYFSQSNYGGKYFEIVKYPKNNLDKGTYKFVGFIYCGKEFIQTKKTDYIEIMIDVIDGKYGNGNARIEKLTKAGYNYIEIQKKVNEYYSVADDVIAGAYGNGQTRFKRLEKAGYNSDLVQKIVNRILNN